MAADWSTALIHRDGVRPQSAAAFATTGDRNVAVPMAAAGPL